MFISGFTAFLNLYVTQPLLPQFRQLFRASELLVSLTVSAPVLAMALTAAIIGLVADSVGRKRVIIASMLGLAVPTILAATATNLGQLVVWRFLQGFFTAGVASVTVAYISEESPLRSVGSIMAMYVTGALSAALRDVSLPAFLQPRTVGAPLLSSLAQLRAPEPWHRGGFSRAPADSSANATSLPVFGPWSSIFGTPAFWPPMR